MKMLVQIAAQNKKRVTDFYNTLDFNTSRVSDSSTIIYDNQFQILANHAQNARLSICLFPEEYDKYVSHLDNAKDNEVGCLIQTPEGCLVNIHKTKLELPISKRRSLVGNYYGIGIECFDLQVSLKFWESIGFKIKQGKLESGYITLCAGDSVDLTLFKMDSCPHQFFNPSITFFNGKVNNPKIIQKLRERNIALSEEITCFNDDGIVDNVIIVDPGGLHFFLFNDG